MTQSESQPPITPDEGINDFRQGIQRILTVIFDRVPRAELNPEQIADDLTDALSDELDRLYSLEALHDTARQTALREANDLAHNEGHRLEALIGIEAARGARCVAHLIRRLAETEHRPGELSEADYARLAEQRVATRRVLTPNEYSGAWWAVEGASGEEGADPGSVLNTVLRALHIDPPAAPSA
ncbi:hypothetical protein OTB20_19530 [Streptomyces sp. H27-H1]|uniref:hypothetical protein n=1 Tax=Streptomyces sp. H27-H1 TaxID=2996461 RepID=UPI00226F86D4|nr:hypothetical protein [Streptomyces sp. H27-H1]MCY0928349.1 hypothetical protein [Streptomyces sp. H27-H1]